MDYQYLALQNDKTSKAFIEYFVSSDVFEKLAAKQLELTKNRDDEDAAKLQVGVVAAQEAGVLPKNPEVSQKIMIDVQGKTADEVRFFRRPVIFSSISLQKQLFCLSI